jgi:ABC-type Zn2+ transport system substrate-binding protein/surface adhesin
MEENITYKDGHLRLKLDKIARDPEDPDDDKSDDDDKPDEESEDEESNDDEHSEEEDEDEHSGHESEEENDDFHVLPAPKDGSLDRSIEKATRVALVMVRTYLEDWSDNMAHYLKM